MCGGGGSQDYGDLAGGIANMFASSPAQTGVGSVPAPAMQGDTMSGIGSYMPAQQPSLGSGSYMAPQTPSYAAESLYSPEAAAQARLASMPQTQAMSVAELTPQATAAAAAPPAPTGLTEAQKRDMFETLGYRPVRSGSLIGLGLQNTGFQTYTNERGAPMSLVPGYELARARAANRGR